MSKCPRCFNPLVSDWFAWTEVKPTKLENDERATAFSGRQVRMGKTCELRRPQDAPRSWVPEAQWPESQLGGPAAEICPICHYELPYMWRWGTTTCLVMAGARATGKTVYIAVLIKQLQKHAERLNTIVEPANKKTAEMYENYYERPLFEERGILGSTPSASTEGSHQHEPLIFTIGTWNGVKHYLVIRDVAGEDLENANVEGLAWQFFAASDAVLFMFDPLKVDEIRHQLQDLVPMQTNRGGDPRTVLRTVMDLLGHGNPKLAVILSKFDALQALQNVKGSDWGSIMTNAGAAFSRDPSLRPVPYDDADGQLLDAEVSSLLQKLDAGPMLKNLENPRTGQRYTNRFFAVSALGESPVGARLHANGITPFRCMDPVRWVLAEQGVL
ncbi:hypothetical protein DFJ75_3452 [Williamsia muralis]|uniref:Uncharacterized protein n=1 Tax=Williamsia marianensis TaxID=85044 RepID=A0A495K7W5_WILMA|nr:hypothetical protein [Williamsia muralis]RKR96599.1 hypothetical protein DFJ75_3452 [Williamsia muralis]